jgi:predicted nucleic acid-binding protein
MIVLDTNVISEIRRKEIDPGVAKWLLLQAPEKLFATAISLAEAMHGIEILPDGQRKAELRRDMEDIFARLFPSRILPFDEHAALTYGRLVASARADGRAILMADGQIASIARIHGFTVATRDTAPFEAAGVPVINPWQM